jgi:hypothetical protein
VILAAVRPSVDSILVADPPEAWEALGFTIVDGVAALGGVRIRLGCPGEGIVGWSLRGLAGADLDGLPTSPPAAGAPDTATHPNGAIAVDHLVALTPDFDRTLGRLVDAGLDYRRTREAGDGFRQAFFVVGPCLLELAGPAAGEVRFWGLTLAVSDLDATASALGAPVKDAVQPGRRIATVPADAGISVPLALMTPR